MYCLVKKVSKKADTPTNATYFVHTTKYFDTTYNFAVVAIQ